MRGSTPFDVRRISSLLLLASSGFGMVPASAQAPTGPASQEDINHMLLERIKDLEDQVQQLKADQAAFGESQAKALRAAVAPAAPPAAPPAAADIPEINEVAPRLKLDVFADVNAEKYTHIPDTFSFGSLDLFMTGQLSNKVSALGELLFIAQSDNSIGVDVERLLLKYRQSDYLSATVGRFHTWVGYYNSTYNKAGFLETTTDRPFVYAFDDAGGVLPMQDVGLNLTGRIPSGGMRLNYVFEVGNGRGWGLDTEPSQNKQDANNSKSINGGLFIRPARFSGLQAGFSVRHDNLTVPGPAVGETIATAHGVYNNGIWEILNEGVLVRHAQAGGDDSDTAAFYSQFSKRIKSVRPYFRYQYFNAPSDDPVYVYASPNEYVPSSVATFVGRLNGPSAGIRYDFTEDSAVKLQYDYYSFRNLPSENGVTLQVAYSF